MKKIKTKEKSGIIHSYKLLWGFMNIKEKITFICIFLFSIITALTKTFIPLIPSLIIAKLSNEKFLIFGFINLTFLNTISFFIVICAIPIFLWVLGMLHYRMIDVFARKMMCVINEKSQDIILLERKNLDFGMTIGETNYIIKSAVDNIYNLIEPFCWNLVGNILSVIFMSIQIFTISYIAGIIELCLIIIILLCVFIRTKIQKGVVDKIEVENAKIGNHFLMSLTNLSMITMLKSKHKELQELRKLNNSFYKENVKRANIGFWYWVIVIAIEYIGLAGIIITYYLTSTKVAILASITTLIAMMNEVYGMVEEWGYLINDLQTSAIKLANLEKIYPKHSIKNQDEVNLALLNEKISKIEAINYKIKFENFEKIYNQVFVSGKIYVISGMSGQGKTTLINAICGLREIESGRIIINDKYNIKNLYNYREKISYLFQDSLLFDRSLTQNIAYPEDNLNEKAKELIKIFNMQEIVKREQKKGNIASTLSGGEKKRIDIIRTISKDRDVYFFDEPTNELDALNVENVLSQIKVLAKDNKIVIIISHDKRCLNIADTKVEL